MQEIPDYCRLHGTERLHIAATYMKGIGDLDAARKFLHKACFKQQIGCSISVVFIFSLMNLLKYYPCPFFYFLAAFVGVFIGFGIRRTIFCSHYVIRKYASKLDFSLDVFFGVLVHENDGEAST